MKDGKPYILSMEAGPAMNGGDEFNFVAKSVFASQEDMDYYLHGCAAHEEYKVFLRENAPVESLKVVCFEIGVSSSIV
jgi:hypothetical protein